MKLGHLLLAGLVLSSIACKSKEEQACRSQEKWVADMNTRLGHPAEPMTKDALAACIAEQHQARVDFRLDEASYQALLDCRIAAKTMDEGLDCLGPATEALMASTLQEIDKQFEVDQQAAKQRADAAIDRLEAHVGSGAIAAQTIAALRERERTPEGRVEEVVNDAIRLIESGRVGAANPITIELQPGIGLEPNEPRVGIAAAEISFVDRTTNTTIARLAPLTTDHLGAKNDEIAALLAWMLEDPSTRQVEILAKTPTRATGLNFGSPDAIDDAAPRFEAAGIAERPVIWLDDQPMTLARWRAR